MKKNYRIILIVICLVIFAINIVLIDKIMNERKEISETAEKVSYHSDEGDVKEESHAYVKEEVSKMRIILEEGFYYEPISDIIKDRITGVSYKENDKIDYSDLRYVVVKYYDFQGNIQSGELIVNVQVADDVLAIFKELFDNKYQIEKMKLIDDYNADDDASMSDNNTSAFNYRNIDGTDEISDHGYGIAIDINPLYNPYVRTGYGERNVLPVNGMAYADRTKEFEHKITKGDVCYNAFISRGWQWGGEWSGVIDYQHFYKEVK